MWLVVRKGEGRAVPLHAACEEVEGEFAAWVFVWFPGRCLAAGTVLDALVVEFAGFLHDLGLVSGGGDLSWPMVQLPERCQDICMSRSMQMWRAVWSPMSKCC